MSLLHLYHFYLTVSYSLVENLSSSSKWLLEIFLNFYEFIYREVKKMCIRKMRLKVYLFFKYGERNM